MNRDQNKCTHEVIRSEQVIACYDHETDEPVYETKYDTWSTLQDIDTHRMKCSQCGKIEYYSGAARAFYEDGVPNEIVQMGIGMNKEST